MLGPVRGHPHDMSSAGWFTNRTVIHRHLRPYTSTARRGGAIAGDGVLHLPLARVVRHAETGGCSAIVLWLFYAAPIDRSSNGLTASVPSSPER
jgi:hypothetical protein